MALSLSLSSPFTFLTPKSQICRLSLHSPAIFSPLQHSQRYASHPFLPQRISLRKRPIWRVFATSTDVLRSETPVDQSQLTIPSDDNTTPTIISTLLLIAFVGLTILTIGVVYIAVTDFLQKREGEKFEKEENDKKKKSKKKKKVRARTGPRGFGQKIDTDDD